MYEQESESRVLSFWMPDNHLKKGADMKINASNRFLKATEQAMNKM